MVTGSACSSVELGSRVSDGLNGCECKHRVVVRGAAGASPGTTRGLMEGLVGHDAVHGVFNTAC